MATQGWQNVVDLTIDSDKSDMAVSPPLPRKTLKKTPIPLPDNVRHLFGPTTTPPIHSLDTQKPKASGILHSTTSNGGSKPNLKGKGITSMTSNGRPVYTPLYPPYNGSNGSGNDIKESARKRRKLSGSQITRPAASSAPTLPCPPAEVLDLSKATSSSSDEDERDTNDNDNIDRRIARPQAVQKSVAANNIHRLDLVTATSPSSDDDSIIAKPQEVPKSASIRTTYHTAGTKLSSMKGTPSVGYLQAQLSLGGPGVGGISEDVLESSGRTLQIGRMTEETSQEQERYEPIEDTVTPVDEPELGESDLDESGWDEMEVTLSRDQIAYVQGTYENPGIYQACKSPRKPTNARLGEHHATSISLVTGPDPSFDKLEVEASTPQGQGSHTDRSPRFDSADIPEVYQARKSPRDTTKKRLSSQDAAPILSRSALASWSQDGEVDESSAKDDPDDTEPLWQSHSANYVITNGPYTKKNRRFTVEEQHLLVYLKEVKQLRWADIKKEFPTRTMGVIQSHYCTTLNRRDRTKDPPGWKHPPKYASATAGPAPSIGDTDSPLPVRRQHHHQAKGAEHHPPQRNSEHAPWADQNAQSFEHDAASGDDSAPRRGRGRPRRNVQAVNYTWPRRHRRSHANGGFDDDSIVVENESPHSPEPSVEPSIAQDIVLPVEQPMDIDYTHEDANLVMSGDKLPYLNHNQRAMVRAGPKKGEWDQITSRSWRGCVFHVDFNDDELQIVEDVTERIFGRTQHSTSQHRRLRHALKDQSEPKLLRLAHALQKKLPSRNKSSIEAFIQDASLGQISKNPRIERLGSARPSDAFSSVTRISNSEMIRQRELGLHSKRGWKTATKSLSYQIKNKVYDTFGPVYSFTEGSSDIHTVAWSPDGQNFAAGAVCVTDRDSMQYNRPNNLLYGDTGLGTIRELAEHRLRRERPDSGPNSTHEMHVTQEKYLYHTVSAVAFSTTGEYLFSAGYDKTAIVWRVSDNGRRIQQPELIKALTHKAEVDLLAVSRYDKLATASRKSKRAIKVCSIDANQNITAQTFSSFRSDNQPDLKILPTALKFEPTYGRLLLAGFGANQREDRLDTTGDICLWDVQTGTELAIHGSHRNVFDLAWVPNQVETSIFAVGCVAGGNVNRGTRSTVRVYDGRGFEKRTCVLEVECPALDMNDVIFCPYDENLVAAGCTSGRTYVWDLRNPDSFLYALSHGKSTMPLDEHQDREVTDTGVRFLSWGENATRLYTGSSDGVVKVWDVTKSAQDVFIKDLVTFDSGVMSGAFNSDKSKLVLGEVNGSVNVLEVGNDDRLLKDVEKMRYLPYEDATDDSMSVTSHFDDSGRADASALLRSGEMITVPFGGFPVRQAVQGPSYAGPFDQGVDAPFLREQALEFQLNISRTPGPQCDIPLCRDSVVKVTIEEIGDSGRSTDRIPDELRRQQRMVVSDLTVVPGKSKCTNCGRPARPLEDGDQSTAALPLCERCRFSCFRCGAVCRMKPETERLVCQGCFRVWDMGALGYECVEETGCRDLPPKMPTLTRYQKEIERAQSYPSSSATFGDEMNALTDYYFSLAIDRPEPPPL